MKNLLGTIRAAALVFAALGAAAFARAEPVSGASFWTGNNLHDWLNRPKGDPFFALGTGYVIGVADGLRNVRQPIGFCFTIPPRDGVNATQVIDIVKAYLQSNAQSRNAPGSLLVSAALVEAFPCATK